MGMVVFVAAAFLIGTLLWALGLIAAATVTSIQLVRRRRVGLQIGAKHVLLPIGCAVLGLALLTVPVNFLFGLLAG
ncbi:hypothetical protein [Agromyces mangrovi Wang et al. 2018]|uniref:hypothetical protein n=1 Tax=Agromyces mangrovi TaxID=1858653 RepID=UPI002573AB4D|nr:hypothetical protein [Agromyces mangrovi]BDZ63541.1 hypothetical protein GCM10025877_04790 [Agromyces mangrovi]